MNRKKLLLSSSSLAPALVLLARYRRTSAAILFAALTAIACPHDVRASDWPMFLKDAKHSSSADKSPAPPLAVKWTFKTSGPIYSSPIVYKNTVIAASYDKNIYALDADTGGLLWTFTTGGEILSAPAAANDVVYVGSKDRFLYALNAKTGALIWKFETPDVILTSPAVADDTVYVGSGDNYLYAVGSADGKRKWRMHLLDYRKYSGVYASAAYAGASVFAAGKNGIVYSFSAKSGGKNWSYQTKSAIYSSPVIADGVIFAASLDRTFYALDTDKGKLRWKRKFNGASYASPVIAGDNAYLALKNGKIKIFNRHTGQETGEIALGEKITSTPVALGSDLLLAADNAGSIYVINTKTKNILWRRLISGPIHASPAVTDNAVYIASEDGSVYSLTAESKK